MIVEMSLYAFAAVLGCVAANDACHPLIFDGANPVSDVRPKAGRM
jgi:hypothetical protein